MQPTMRPVAQAVQAQGRGKDTMLMHMSPREVGGLQALALAHGGSLTINPQTGLPEAGFLENILPTLLGVGLSFIPGVGPMMAAGLVGGGTAIATGDISKGLMAGLGAFGGANLAAGLGAAGAQQGVQAAGAAGQDLMTQAVTNTPGIAETGAQLIPNAPTTTMADIYNTAGARDALLMRNAQALPASVQALPTATAPTFASNAAQAGQGLQNVFASGQTGEAARTAFMGNVGGASGLAKDVGMIVAPTLVPEPYKPPKPEKSTYEGPYVPTPREVRFPTAEERKAMGTSEFTYFTPSNPVPGFQPYSATQSTQSGTLPSTSSTLAMLSDEEKRRAMGMKEGGIAALARGRRETRKGMPPRFLAGGGDGMSDSIPAVIDNKQPARLADGEFVVPADVVSHLGNGSSKAGAKKLYAMMDRVRQARTGKKRQAPEINMRRMMPA